MSAKDLVNAVTERARGAGSGLAIAGSIFALFTTSIPAYAAPPARGSAPAPTARPGGDLSGDEGGNSCKKWPAGKKFTITIPREAELEQLVQWMMTISCQKFIWNGKIRSGKVTILSPEKVTLREAYAAFYAAIESMGLTVEPTGDYFKIVESADAKSLNLPVYEDGRPVPNNDRYVTQLVRIKSGSTADITAVAGKLKSKQGSVEVVGNLLIITDRGSVVRRLLKIIKELDEGGGTGEKIFFYQLQYADAEEVAQIVRDVFGESSGSSKTSKTKKKSSTPEANFSRVIVDPRTGTLIITTSESDYATILKLIQQLDVRLPGGGGRIHVKQLRNADPKELAQVLQSLTQGGGGGSAAKKGGNKAATAGGASAELFSGDVKITADEATRSLVIIASAADYKSLEPIIDELDRDRKQVYLEIYLLEASVGRSLTTGAGAHFAGQFGQGEQQSVGLISSSPSPDVSSILLSPAALSGLAGGLIGPQLIGTGAQLGLERDIPAFGVVIQALQSNDDVNIVAEPHIYTADNKEAQIEVGRKVPTPGALQFGGAGGGTSLTPLQSINREDVTLDIKVTPHVKDETSLTLDIELEDRDVVDQDPVLGVTTTKRRIKLENVLARDDLPVVLGGLMRERELENTQQVPGLGSIPILGWLFKRRVKQKEKINLLIVLIPHVVETADDIRRIHERRTRERMEFLERETSFKRRDLDTNVNYRSKAGLLANIDREARRLEQQEMLLRQAEAELASEQITGELGMSPRPAEEDGGTTSPAPKTKARATKKK
ncbi:type II and III secretion system protein [Plesiocystis pacifica SIR-1]|uniref:Type II and III secretion system protein n=1 Tax=Plesiocystis pacifica SIR-1 TaxID=391625 RepID=A6FZI7_9BACT|nr:type II secretion system secretin GspD [Plesiocystis pacifica]EDM81071.1 type II and III secretion system protein [Plesiocystis pacifica SIR-1]